MHMKLWRVEIKCAQIYNTYSKYTLRRFERVFKSHRIGLLSDIASYLGLQHWRHHVFSITVSHWSLQPLFPHMVWVTSSINVWTSLKTHVTPHSGLVWIYHKHQKCITFDQKCICIIHFCWDVFLLTWKLPLNVCCHNIIELWFIRWK